MALMEITLYGDDNEVKATYSRMFVPWKLLKKAIGLAKHLDKDNLTEDNIDELAGLVVEVFGNKFSVAELNDGADVGEMMTVLTTIISKAQMGAPANPTQPGK